MTTFDNIERILADNVAKNEDIIALLESRIELPKDIHDLPEDAYMAYDEALDGGGTKYEAERAAIHILASTASKDA